MRPSSPRPATAALLLAAAAAVGPLAPCRAAAGDDGGADATPWKLTTGFYEVRGGGLPAGPGLDVNLRYSVGDSHAWLGYFRSPVLGVSQPRAGWDGSVDAGPLRLLPSVQVASGGFVGGSLNVETGERWTVGAGIRRTNLRDYANLNFDPNDALSLYGGYKWDDGNALSVLGVRDDRQHPDQQHVHLVWRHPLGDGRRLTVDLLAKQGTLDDTGERIHRTGLTLTCDWPRWSLRAAWDPKVNFSTQDMLRLSVATRF